MCIVGWGEAIVRLKVGDYVPDMLLSVGVLK